MKVAVNTPTGNIGRALTKHLLDAGADVVLLTRSPDKVKQFAERGATVHVGNLEDADFVVRATKGVDTLFWLTPPNMATTDFRAHQGKLADIAVKAIKENKIPRVVNLSSIGAHLSSGTGPIVGLHDVEKKLDRAGANVTHLRAGFFMENLFMAAQTIAKDGAVYMPVRASAQMAMIATRDIARAAADRMLDAGWTGRTVIELVGPAEVTFEGMTGALSKALGKQIRFVTTTSDQMRQALTGMGVPPKTADLFIEMYGAFDKGKIAPEFPKNTKTGSTTLSVFAEQVYRPGFEAMTKSHARV
jgi:uncharacterized protein YbjT (DUF2867 family)